MFGIGSVGIDQAVLRSPSFIQKSLLFCTMVYNAGKRQNIWGLASSKNTDHGKHSMEWYFMKHLSFLRLSFFPATLLIASSSVFAQSDREFQVIPYVDIGISEYTVDFSSEGFNADFIIRGTMAKAGVVVSWGKLYANAYYRDNGEGSDTLPLPDGSLSRITGKRKEGGAAIGYRLTPEMAVFVGYRSSEAEISGQPAGGIITDDNGYSLGGSYQLNITDSGSLNFSLGYAWLDIDFDGSVPIFGVPIELAGAGDGSGLKFAVAWRDFLNEDWGYALVVERFDYKFDGKGELGGSDFDIENGDTTISLGLFYVF